jgi:hypothetical protein
VNGADQPKRPQVPPRQNAPTRQSAQRLEQRRKIAAARATRRGILHTSSRQSADRWRYRPRGSGLQISGAPPQRCQFGVWLMAFDRRSSVVFQANYVGDDIGDLVLLQDEVRHCAMRCTKEYIYSEVRDQTEAGLCGSLLLSRPRLSRQQRLPAGDSGLRAGGSVGASGCRRSFQPR